MKKLFNRRTWILRAPISTVSFINVAFEVQMGLITELFDENSDYFDVNDVTTGLVIWGLFSKIDNEPTLRASAAIFIVVWSTHTVWFLHITYFFHNYFFAQFHNCQPRICITTTQKCFFFIITATFSPFLYGILGVVMFCWSVYRSICFFEWRSFSIALLKEDILQTFIDTANKRRFCVVDIFCKTKTFNKKIWY